MKSESLWNVFGIFLCKKVFIAHYSLQYRPQTEEGGFCATTCVCKGVCCPLLSSEISGLFQILIFMKSYVKILQSGFESFLSWLVGPFCQSHDHGLPWVYSPLSKRLGFDKWLGLTCIGYKRCNRANENNVLKMWWHVPAAHIMLTKGCNTRIGAIGPGFKGSHG